MGYLAEGHTPTTDEKGRTLPAEMETESGQPVQAGMVFSITGDLEWFYNEFGFPRPNTQNPCPWCKCDKGEIPWNDFRSSADWRNNLVSPEEMMSAFHHKLFSVPGVNPLAISIDCLHTLDLGVSSHIVSNLLWELLEKMPQNRNTAMSLLESSYLLHVS